MGTGAVPDRWGSGRSFHTGLPDFIVFAHNEADPDMGGESVEGIDAGEAREISVTQKHALLYAGTNALRIPAHTHTGTHTSTQTHTQTYTDTHRHTQTHIGTHTHRRTHTHTYTHIHTQTRSDTHTHAQTSTHRHTKEQTHTGSHTNTHTTAARSPCRRDGPHSSRAQPNSS